MDPQQVQGSDSQVVFLRFIYMTPTCLGNFAQLLFTDVVQVFLHLQGGLAHLTKGELWVDEDFWHHGLRRNRQCGKVLLNRMKLLEVLKFKLKNVSAASKHLQEVNVVLGLQNLSEFCVSALQLHDLLLKSLDVAVSLGHGCLHVGHNHLVDLRLPALHSLQHLMERLVALSLSSLGTTLTRQKRFKQVKPTHRDTGDGCYHADYHCRIPRGSSYLEHIHVVL